MTIAVDLGRKATKQTKQTNKHCAHVQKEGQNTQCLYIRFTWRLKNDGYQLCVLTDSLLEHKRVIVKLFSMQQG